jgi:hypothetical protein
VIRYVARKGRRTAKKWVSRMVREVRRNHVWLCGAHTRWSEMGTIAVWRIESAEQCMSADGAGEATDK